MTKTASTVRTGIFCLLAVVAAAGLFLRFYHLEADPPVWTYVYNTDEGHYSYTAQNRLVWGHWFVNDAKYGLATPLFSFAQYAAAAVKGGANEIASYRFVSAIAGALVCLLMTFFFVARWQKLAALALTSLSFIGLVHSRLGITETLLTLTLQVTVLAAWQSLKRANVFLAAAAGALALSCLLVKPTGGFALALILAAPLLCPLENRVRVRFWLGALAGVALLALLWALFVVWPHREEWRHMLAAYTVFGRERMGGGVLALARNLWQLLVSPALLTMPCLWPLALCWTVACGVPSWWKKQNDLLDTLVLLWLGASLAILGSCSYQPARWQVMLLPAVVYGGLKFLPCLARRPLAVAGATAMLALSLLYGLDVAGGLLSGGPIDVSEGIFSRYTLLLIALGLFAAAYFAARRLGSEHWQSLAAGIIGIELLVQCGFHCQMTLPSFHRPSPWEQASHTLAGLSPNAPMVLAGDNVECFALRARLRVFPTYYLLTEPNDAAVRQFCWRQNIRPTHFSILEDNLKSWTENAPGFFRALQEVAALKVNVGGFGARTVRIYRMTAYDWLDVPQK